MYCIDPWGQPFCKDHEHEYPKCELCSRLIPPNKRVVGLPGCTLCSYDAVTSLSIALPLFNTAKAWIRWRGIPIEKVEIPLTLCSSSVLKAQLGSAGDSKHLGMTMKLTQSRGQQSWTSVSEIRILCGLPKILFIGVCIHELGHAWLHLNNITELPAIDEEGFCEMLSFAYYNGSDDKRASYFCKSIESKCDPIYGDGFRKVLALQRRYGFAPFINALLRNGAMPH